MPARDFIKQHYVDTLMQMAQTWDITKITVSALIAEAQTARQTFYNRFSDIDDLICYAASVPGLSGEYAVFDIENTRALLNYASEHRAFFMQLARHHGPHSYRDAHIAWMNDIFESYILEVGLAPNEEEYCRAAWDIFARGSSELYLAWLADGLKTPVDVIVRAIDDATPSFVRERRLETPKQPGFYPR